MSELTERLWASDVASALTNEAARALEAQEAKIAELEKKLSNHHQYLEFIERWAVYKYGPAEERLSVIAHYPPISAISKALTPSLPK